MPKMRPVPIPTKENHILVRIWRWITYIRKWEIIEDWEYDLPDGDHTVIVPNGFVFDGASIPRPLWGLLSPTGLLLIPGLIHDYGYRYDYLWALNSSGEAYRYKKGAGQEFWDKLFNEVGLDVNGMAIIDRLAWAALALFGTWAWNSNRKRNAPELFPNRPIQKDAQPGDESTPMAAAG